MTGEVGGPAYRTKHYRAGWFDRPFWHTDGWWRRRRPQQQQDNNHGDDDDSDDNAQFRSIRCLHTL